MVEKFLAPEIVNLRIENLKLFIRDLLFLSLGFR